MQSAYANIALSVFALLIVLAWLGYRVVSRRNLRSVESQETGADKVFEGFLEQQSVLEAAGVGIAFLRDRKFIRCNHAFAQMCGYEVADLVGASTRRLFVSEAQYNHYGEEAYACLRNGTVYETDAFHRRSDDSTLWVHTTLTAIDAFDLSKGVVWVMHNIDERKRIEQALSDSEARFRSLAELSSDWYWEQGPDLRFTMMSGGLTPTRPDLPTAIGKCRWELPIEMSEQQWVEHRQTLEAHRPFTDLEYKVHDELGRIRWCSVSGEPVFGPHGEFKGYRGIGRDITASRQSDLLHVGQGEVLELIACGAELDEILSRLVLLIEGQSDGIIGSILLLDEQGTHLAHCVAPNLPSTYTEKLIGVSIGERTGSCGTAIARRQRVIVTDIANDDLWVNYRELALEHGLLACWSTPIVATTGSVRGAFAMYYRQCHQPSDAELRLADIATRIADLAIERRETEAQIRHMAHHDALTGLPNRSLLQDRVNQAIAQTDRMGSNNQVALLFVDLDHFKHVNDTLGHAVGDQLLQMVAERLQLCLRKGDSLARLGGDEFVITLPAINQTESAALVAQKVLDALEKPFLVDLNSLHISGSIGIAVFPADGRDAETLMRAADIAMYHAKEKGRSNYQFITPRLNENVQNRMTLGKQLRHALGRGELSLHFQPQIDLFTGRITAAEALLRWTHPERGMISPAEFIPVAEETGLIVPIGEWVLRQACIEVLKWRANGNPDIRIAVNLSTRQILQSGYAESVLTVLQDLQVPASALELEITESLLMQPSDETLSLLRTLSKKGIKLALDDFGTGYSSLTYLRRFPIDTVKIDQFFVRGLGTDGNDNAIALAIIAMAKSLGMRVIAEGVETEEQMLFLKEHACAEGQGYYFSRPVSSEAFQKLLGRTYELSSAVVSD